MVYQVRFTRAATRQLRRLPPQIQTRIHRRITSLEQNPRPVGSQQLRATSLYRIRVGNYRVIYTIEDSDLVVLVVRVGHRRDVYDRIDEL